MAQSIVSAFPMSEPAIPETERAPSASAPSPAASSGAPGSTTRRRVLLLLKVLVSVVMLAEIYRRVLGREGATDVLGHLDRLDWRWFGLAVSMQLLAIGCGIVRWRRLLGGQGIRAPWSFLASSWMIGRFWGAVTPGGLGLDGWRLYETARHTHKAARATALAGVEKILGQLAFGAVVLLGSVYGLRFIGVEGVLLVNAFFVVLVGAGLTLLTRPQLFRALARVLPAKAQLRVATLVEAVCAYQGKGGLLAQAAFLGMGVHAFNNLIYVCAARALHVELDVGAVFFASSLQIMATLLPTSINGMGLREAAAVALYTSPAVGLSLAQAVLIPTVGFAAEMTVSACGALVFLTRRSTYAPAIVVEHPEREDAAHAAIETAPEHAWPKVRRGAELGTGAGALAGLLVGVAEGLVVVWQGHGRTGPWVVAYGAIAYAIFFALAGAGGGAASAWLGRLMKRAAYPEDVAWARGAAFFAAACAFGLTAFHIRRDVFDETLRWASPSGLGVALGCAAGAGLLYLGLAALLRVVARRAPFLLRAAGTPAAVAGAIAVLVPLTLGIGEPARANATGPAAATPPAGAGNVLVIVVDTLRADHLPSYGYEAGATPNLDAFAADAIRFDQAFANASWTRPSFASILTGRFPSSHGVMSKSSALPGDVVTLPEAYFAEGWHTGGVVTNYNIAPYFNFDQGFVEYRYLEPDFVMGADDSAAKLLLVQFLRQRLFEPMRDRLFGVQPGVAYQDAAEVNAALLSMIDAAPAGRPWMMFAGYMDPHDPYYVHPYDGEAYARAAHPSPVPAEAERLTALYDGEITYWDEHFGRLLDALRERGVYDDLTIVVTSDHGEELGEHGGFWHGTTLYDEQVHVPLFVRLPGGRRSGTVVRHWVQSVDLMPTLLAEAGIEVPAGVAGASLFSGSDRLFAEESHEGNVLAAVRERRPDGEVKLITANAGNPRGLRETELYRVDVDPGEADELSAREPALLEEARNALDAAAVLAAEGAVEGVEAELDEADRARLCALGYLTGEACP